jgi:ribonuclease BN (tRNA processing enzyme)
MRITFLGSGGAFCDFRVNFQNNAVIDTEEGPVLLDCGVTALQSLKELGIRAHDVRAVLVTHLHADHASPAVLVGERYYKGPDSEGASFLPTPILAPRDVVEPLVASLVPYLDEYQDRSGVIRPGGTRVMVDAKAVTETEIGGTRFRFFRVPHVVGAAVDKPAYGVEIRDARSAVAWSGDTTFSPQWIERTVESVDTLFHECTFAPRARSTVHTHWPELASLPREVGRRIVLMHHTAVPAGLDVSAVRAAAARHDTFEL